MDGNLNNQNTGVDTTTDTSTTGTETSTIILRMCVYNYNRLGTEGLDSEGYSGVSFA